MSFCKEHLLHATRFLACVNITCLLIMLPGCSSGSTTKVEEDRNSLASQNTDPSTPEAFEEQDASTISSDKLTNDGASTTSSLIDIEASPSSKERVCLSLYSTDGTSEGKTTYWDYDDKGNKICEYIYNNGKGQLSSCTKYEYDETDQMISAIEYDIAQWDPINWIYRLGDIRSSKSYEYSDDGYTERSFDAENNLVGETTYDSNGNISLEKDYIYAKVNNFEQKQISETHYEYSYDNADRILEEHSFAEWFGDRHDTTEGSTVNEYDDHGNLIFSTTNWTSSNPLGKQGTEFIERHLEYDSAGRIVKETSGSNSFKIFSYENEQATDPVQVDYYSAAGALTQSYYYEYDICGKPSYWSETTSGTLTKESIWAYDYLDNVAEQAFAHEQ